MKRTFLLFFLLISIFSFSQSEIWGIKQQAGRNNGGFLFSIDSASNKIIEHQYFANPKELTKKSEVFYDSILKCMFGVSNQVLYKYDLVSRTTESKILKEEVFGSFYKASNNYLYILSQSGLLKMNPNDLSLEIVGQLYGQFILPDTNLFFDVKIGTSFGLNKVSEDHFVVSNYTTDNSYHWNHSFIYSINTNTDSIELIYRTSIFPENESLIPLGKFYPYNGMLYSLFSINNTIALYSLNTLTNEFSKKHIFHNLVNYQNNIAYTISSDGRLIGKARLSRSMEYCLFQYDLSNEQFEYLAEVPYGNDPHNRMIMDDKNDLYLLLSTPEDFYIRTAFYKYNFEINQLDSLFYLSSQQWHYLSYDEYGPLVSFENGFISFMDNKEGLNNHIVFYNIEQQRIDTIARLHHSLNFTDSIPMPTSFCETQKGNILLLNSRELRIPGNGYKFFFSFTEFNPQSKELIRTDEFELTNYCFKPQIYNMNNDDYCISCAQNNVIIKYNRHTNEMIYVPTPFSGDWLKEGDDSFIITTDSSGIYRFHIESEQLEELYKPNTDTTFDLVCLDNENQLIIYSESCEHLLSFDLNSNKISTIFQLNEINDYIVNFRVVKLLSEGEHVFIIATDLSSYTKKLFRYHLPSHELKLINREENTDLQYYQFIENYTDDGVFIASLDPDNNKAGDLKSLLNSSDSSVILDNFENKTTSYENMSNSPLQLIKAKNKPIHRWIGEVNNNWYEAENWSNRILPNDSSSVNIMNDAAFYPEIDTVIKMKNLYIYDVAKMILKPKAQVQIFGDFKNHGLLKMMAIKNERSSLIVDGKFIQSGQQNYIYCADFIKNKTLASPIKAIEKYVNPFYEEAVYDDVDSLFNEILFYPNFTEQGRVFQYSCEDTLIEFKGAFNHGLEYLQIPPLLVSDLYPLPNPYPSTINWNKAQHTSLTHQACYFYNEKDSSFSAAVDGIGNHPPIIRPLEVFWVYGNGEESIQLDASAQLHEQLYEEEISNKKFLSLQVSRASKVDETVIAFNKLASYDYDPQYDAFKFIQNHTYPHIFTKSEDDLLMINQVPDTTMMDLFVQMGEGGRLKIKLNENHGFEYLVLEDLIWNTRTDLLENDYQFDYFTSDGHYPFKLYFKPWILEPIDESDIQMYYYPEYLVIKSRKQVKQAEIIFYDLAGRAVLEFNEQNFFHLEKPISIPAGHYIVQFRSGDLVVNEKILVR